MTENIWLISDIHFGVHYPFNLVSVSKIMLFNCFWKLFISFFVLTTILLVTVIVILIIGMPFEAIGISKNLHRIGLVNSAGEAPLLLSKDKGNGKIMIYKFKTLGIPLSDWEDKQSKIIENKKDKTKIIMDLRNDLLDCVALVLGLNHKIDNDIVTTYKIKEIKNNFKPNILLVEDNEMNRKITVLMLKSKQLCCDIALNGKEAYEASVEKKYDIIFMDCQMPVMDGYEATNLIRTNGKNKDTPIVAMTANAMKGDREKCISVGMDEYISKPIDFDRMFEIIDRYSVKNQELDFSEYINKFIQATGMGLDETTEMYEEFKLYLPEIIKQIEENNNNKEENNFAKISTLAHQLKGSAGTLKILHLYELSKELESAAKVGDKKRIQDIINEIKELYRIIWDSQSDFVTEQ